MTGDPLRQAGTSSKTIVNCFVWCMTSRVGQSWYLGKVDSASNVPVAGGIHAWFHWSLPRFNSSIQLYPTNHASLADLGWNKYHQPKTPLPTASPQKIQPKTSPKNLAAKTHRNPPVNSNLLGRRRSSWLFGHLSFDLATFHMGNVQQY